MTELPPPPQGPQATPAGVPPQSNGLAITALITGILSIVLCLYWFLALPLGIIAVATGVMGKKAADVKGSGGAATAGVITGAIGAILALAGLIMVIFLDNWLETWLCEQNSVFC